MPCEATSIAMESHYCYRAGTFKCGSAPSDSPFPILFTSPPIQSVSPRPAILLDAGKQVYSTALEDSESCLSAGESSDSDSEGSLNLSTGSHSPFVDPHGEDDVFLLPPSLLFLADVSVGTSRSQCLEPAKSLARHVPDDLQDMLQVLFVEHDPFSRKLGIVIGEVGGRANQEDTYPVYSSPIEILHISIMVSDIPGHGITTEKQFQLLLCILRWAQIIYGNTVEEVNISVPKTFPLSGEIIHIINGIEPFANMHSLTWAGDAHLLPHFISCLLTASTQLLTIQAEMSVDDALHLTGILSSSRICSLELGVITGCPSRVASLIHSANRVDNASRVVLPTIDSFKVSATVSLNRLFDALALPALCKCECEFGNAGENGEAALRALVASPLLGPHVLYVDVVLQGPFVGMAGVMAHLKERAPFACASFRKTAASVRRFEGDNWTKK